MASPLADLKVLDLSSNLAGPYCGQILADLGAEVLKVERPGRGDPSRAWAPPAWGGEGTLFLAANRGKRSLALEMDTPGGDRILRRLLSSVDVVIQAFRPDVAERFGLTEALLRPDHPGLILCSITAFTPEGPHRSRPGYDPLLQAHAGLMSVTGPPGGPPVRVGTSIVDMGAGMWAALGVMAALRTKEATGRGTHVQVALEDTALAWGAYHLQGTLATGHAPAPMGTGLPMIVPYGTFPTADGQLMISAGTDALFRRCCEALKLDTLAEDPALATNPQRVAAREQVEGAVSAATREIPGERLEALLVEAGVPCARVRSYDEVAADPAVRAGAFRAESHPQIPAYRAVGLPVTSDGNRLPAGPHPPALGEHTREVLGTLGYSATEIRELFEAGVVG